MRSWPKRQSCYTTQGSRRFAERIDGIGRDSLRFRQDVQQLLQTVDPDLPSPGDRLEESLDELFGRLHRAMTDQKNFDLLQSQRKKQEEKRQQAHTSVETLRARLAVLCQEARCGNPEELARGRSGLGRGPTVAAGAGGMPRPTAAACRGGDDRCVDGRSGHDFARFDSG